MNVPVGGVPGLRAEILEFCETIEVKSYSSGRLPNSVKQVIYHDKFPIGQVVMSAKSVSVVNNSEGGLIFISDFFHIQNTQLAANQLP